MNKRISVSTTPPMNHQGETFYWVDSSRTWVNELDIRTDDNGRYIVEGETPMWRLYWQGGKEQVR